VKILGLLQGSNISQMVLFHYNFIFHIFWTSRNFCQAFITFAIFKQLLKSVLFSIFNLRVRSGALDDISHKFLLNYLILQKARIFQDPRLSFPAVLCQPSVLHCTGKFQLLTPGNQFLWHGFYLESSTTIWF
jgi:hypothetical protein